MPTGASVFPEELFVQPGPLAKFKYTNLISYKIMDRGGHFAAYEEPQLLADEVIEFVQKVEKLWTIAHQIDRFNTVNLCFVHFIYKAK